jgi:hypothetical protein
MRVSTERDVVADGEWERGLLALRHDRDASCKLTAIEVRDVVTIDVNGASHDRHTTEERADERALPAPVRAGDSRDGATWNIE